jgi:hypothetical protein
MRTIEPDPPLKGAKIMGIVGSHRHSFLVSVTPDTGTLESVHDACVKNKASRICAGGFGLSWLSRYGS